MDDEYLQRLNEIRTCFQQQARARWLERLALPDSSAGRA